MGTRARERVALFIQHAKCMAVLWNHWLHHIIPHYLIIGTVFGKGLVNIKCMFWASLQFIPETFLILRKIQRDIFIDVKSLRLR